MLHLLVVANDTNKQLLGSFDPEQRDNKINFSSEQYQSIEVANEDNAPMLGVHWFEGQPIAVKETKKLLSKPKIIDASLMAKITPLFSKLAPGITISPEKLHGFLQQHEGEWIICVSGQPESPSDVVRQPTKDYPGQTRDEKIIPVKRN